MSGFSSNTRVGNWSEQAVKEAETLERLTAQREAGTLRSDVHASRLAVANTPVQLPPLGEDGYLRFGQATGVVNSADGVLAACLHDAVLTPELLACSAVLAAPSCVSSVGNSVLARCCLVLESVAPRSVDDEASALTRTCGPDVVHYGQKVRLGLCPQQCADAPPRLRANGSATSPPPSLYLRSGPASATAMARHSKHQHVGWTASASAADTVWVVLTPDPAQQAVSEGQPVMRHAPVLLKHASTQQCLAAEAFGVLTDFGKEAEVSCFTSYMGGAGHRDSLQAVAHGSPEAGVVKTPGTPNVWRFI